jgi:hypothetical protein
LHDLSSAIVVLYSGDFLDQLMPPDLHGQNHQDHGKQGAVRSGRHQPEKLAADEAADN